MNLTTLAWLGMAAYAAHILEEYCFDWRNWARSVVGLPVEWNDFYLASGVVILFGIAQAQVAANLPLAVLSFAALMLINAVFMHILPFVRMKGRFSPGLITAVLLFLPLGIATYWTAISSGAASIGVCLAGFAIGALTLAFPIAMLMLKSKPYFQQDRPAPRKSRRR